jgi:DNA-binding LytR/AlgR family response regulator
MNSKMTIVIIEDEKLNTEQLLFYIHKYDPTITVAGLLKSNKEIVDWFSKNPMPMLVFSDIKLLDGSVFNSLQQEVVTCPIIFTTAFNEFYQNAFDNNGIAYLLKPISYKSFEKAMDKFNRLTQTHNTINWLDFSEVIKKMNVTYKERILIKNVNNSVLVEVKNVIYFSTNMGVCEAFDNLGRSYEFRQKFSDLVSELNPNTFFQINRGEAINIDYIELIEPYFNDRLSIKIKNHTKRLITSSAVTAEFRRWLER